MIYLAKFDWLYLEDLNYFICWNTNYSECKECNQFAEIEVTIPWSTGDVEYWIIL
jgi:hypothetical protein